MNGVDDSCAGASDDKTGGSLPPKSDAPMEILGGRGIPNGTQVYTYLDTGHDKMDNTLLPKADTGLSQNGGTNSYTSANNTDRESHHINQSDMEVEKTEQEKPDNDMIDVMEDVNAYMEIIKKNIEYEHHMRYGDWSDKGLYEELYEVICEIVCVRRKTVKVNGEDYPYELVKSKFMKLDSSHLEYVIGCMKDTTTKITNIRAYMVTALYNAPNTMNHYYQQLVQYDMYGGGWEEKGMFRSETEGDG